MLDSLRSCRARHLCIGCTLALLLLLQPRYTTAQDVPVNAIPAATPAQPRQTDRALTSGLGVGVGYGTDNAWLGGHVVYYQQLDNPRLRIAYHVGAGVYPIPAPDLQWGVVGGSFLTYGKRSRLLIGVYGGTMSRHWFSLHYERLEQGPDYGVGAHVGYEVMTERGFYVRASIGPALSVYAKAPFHGREVSWLVRGNLLSVGYKLW